MEAMNAVEAAMAASMEAVTMAPRTMELAAMKEIAAAEMAAVETDGGGDDGSGGNEGDSGLAIAAMKAAMTTVIKVAVQAVIVRHG